MSSEALFKKAYAVTGGHEGGWNNRPLDRGGETIKGIARNHWPEWRGWAFVDKEKKLLGVDTHQTTSPQLDTALSRYTNFQELVLDFYREHFWYTARCHIVMKYDMVLAILMYDTAVQHSPDRAVRFLQDALNLLNKNGALYANLVTDGKFGNKTETALQIASTKRGRHALRTWYIIVRGAFYTQIMQKSEEQEEFASGWANRLASWMQMVNEEIKLED
jgi:lysozyme family protein